MRSRLLINSIAIASLLCGAVGMQYLYGVEKVNYKAPLTTPSASFLKAVDLGLHSALASFLWIDTRTELPFLQNGFKKFNDDLNLINDLDPKFNTPYVYTVKVLPDAKNYEDKFKEAVRIGLKGVEQADPNYEIPFYVASIYHIAFKDRANAAKYFDLAARTPGIPETVRLFAINYGIFPNYRKQTIGIWQAVYDSAKDDETRERAKAYIVHFQILDLLQDVSEKYKKTYGVWPKEMEDLVKKKFIIEIPADPFGLHFKVYEDQGIVGIK